MKILETERLFLRRWQLEDLGDYHEFAKDTNVGPMAGWEPHSSKEVTLDVLKSYIKSDERWAIVLKETNKVIGLVGICPDENRGKYYAKSISFALSPNYWCKGYMTEVVKCVMQYVFDELNIDLLSAFHYHHNIRSKRVLEKCGFEYEVTLKQAGKRYDGQIFDNICYSITKTDYLHTISNSESAL